MCGGEQALNLGVRKKSREERRTERMERILKFELFKVRGESRGWQIKSSDGIPVWQFIQGGAFQPVSKA